MTICILIEDSRKKSGKAYGVLARRIVGRQKVVLKSPPRGDLLDANKLKVHLGNLKNPRTISKAIVCVDSHSDPAAIGSQTAALQRTFANYRFPVKCVVVVHALESWLLQDPQAVRGVLPLRSSDGQTRKLGDSCQPDRSLSKACNDFAKSVHDERIAQGADVSVIASRSPSFREFVAALRNPS